MITQQALTDLIAAVLKPQTFKDYCPNGLQVAGKTEIKKIITGVSACQALIDVAIEKQADAILVHHGYFWKGESPCLTGIKRQRIASLLANNINLYAYHLPLDAQADWGNNAELAKRLDLKTDQVFNDGLLFCGHAEQSLTADELATKINTSLQREPQVVAATERLIKTIAWCTGAAQDMLEQVAELGIDAFISGEISERTYHIAKEYNIHYFAAGHHATERYGIQRLGEYIAQNTQVECEFVDIDNPV